jgi:hypothetical protein
MEKCLVTGCNNDRELWFATCTSCNTKNPKAKADPADIAAAKNNGTYDPTKNPKNTGGSGGSTSPSAPTTTPTPPTPPVQRNKKISISPVLFTKAGDQYKAHIEITSDSTEEIRMKRGIVEIDKKKVDKNNEAVFTYDVEAGDTEKSIELIFLNKECTPESVSFKIPAKATPASPQKTDEPEEVQVTVWESLTNTVPPVMTSGIHVRVINSAGDGLPGKAVIFCDNIAKPKEISINKHGCGVFTYPDQIKEDESIGIQVAVSGIRDKANVNLLNLKPLPTMPDSYKERFVKSNNFRAVIFTIIMLMSWVICATTFWCSPMLSEAKIITTPETTSISIYEDKVAEMMKTGKVVERDYVPPPKTAKSSGILDRIKAIVLVITFLYTIFVVIYSICAMREEFAYYMRKWSVKLMQRRQSSAQDPLQERIAKMYGAFGHAQKTPAQPEITVTTSTMAGASDSSTIKHEDTSFWKLLRSDLVSDFIMNILYPMVGRALKK